MGLLDDLKDIGEGVVGGIVDIFDGDDQEQAAPPVPKIRPQYQGNSLEQMNPAYAPRKDEFEKPLWMTGADPQSTYSSWNTDFLERMFKQQDELVDKGELNGQFDRKDATGVVTWDHVTAGGLDLKFGDVFDKGKLVGNLYDDAGPDRVNDADLMMSQLLLEPEELANIGGDRNPAERLRDAVEKVRANNNIEIPQALAAAAQQREVDATQKGIQDAGGGLGDDLLSAGLGFLGGGTIGAGFGPLGFLVGGFGGAASAWLNRDDISEQTASAYEITKKAFNDGQGNVIGDAGSALKQWSGVAGRGLSPLSNLTRGLLDSDRGNGIGALQEADRPSWAKPLDIAATIGDMGFTFGSTAGITAYTGQMVGHTAGAITELTAGGGYRWDAHAGEFRNVYKNEQGDVSIANGLGAWASTGIDLAQLAMVRGIASKISGVDQRMVGKVIDGKTVARVDERAGRTFFLDDTGTAIGSRANFSQMFVPSEGVQMLAASGAARVARAKGLGGASAADDLYKASISLARAESPIKAALVNAVGEGTEEAAQEALDTVSFDHKISLQAIAEAYAYGAASGLGMGFATNYRTRTRDAQELKAGVEAGYIAVHGQLPADWDTQYENMTPEERRAHVQNILTPEQLEAFKQTEAGRAALQSSTTKSSQLITHLQNYYVQQEIERTNRKTGAPGDSINRANGNPIFTAAQRNPDGSTKFLSGTHADDAATQGPRSLLFYYEQRLAALPKVLDTIKAERAAAQSEVTRLQSAGANADPQLQKVAELDDMLALWEGTEKFLPDIIKAVRAQVDLLADETQPMPQRLQALDTLNKQLDDLYRSNDDSLSLAAAVLRLRSPYDNKGSFYVGAPAISLSQVKDKIETGFGQDWASLDVTTADFDGDRLTNSVNIALGRSSFRQAQTGLAWLTTSLDQKTGEQETMYKAASVATDVAASITAHDVYTGTWLQRAQDVPSRWLRSYAQAIVTRYTAATDTSSVDYLYTALRARLLDRKSEKPVEELMKFFATDEIFAPLMAAYAQQHRTNEPSVALGIFRSHMDGMQTDINKVMATLVPESEREGAQVGAANDMYPNADGQHKTINPQSAATLLGTFFQYFGTDNLLRLGQVIRLNHQDYTDRGIAKADTDPILDIAGRQMRALSQGHIRAAQEGGLNEFDIAAQVREMALEIVGADQRPLTRREQESAAFNLLISDFGDTQFSGKDKIKARRDVTVAQALTMAYIQQLRVDAAVPLSRDPQLRLKVDMLERAANDARGDDKGKRADGEMLILKDALGAFNVANVLTIGAVADWKTSVLNITGSVEQNIRLLRAQTPEVRAALKRSMLEKKGLGNKRKQYETLVNFMIEVANTEQSRVEKRNEQGSEAAMKIREQVRAAIVEAKLPMTRRGVLEILQTQGGIRIVEGMTNDTSMASFVSNQDGTYTLRDWVAEFFVETDPGRAEVMLWEQRAITLLNLAEARKAMKDDQTDDDYTRIDDSLAKLMDHLRRYSPVQFRELMEQIGKANDRASLEEWISQQDFGFNMPVLMYENSVAQYDPDLAGGGWNAGTTSYGSTMRELLQPAGAFKKRVTQQIKNTALNVLTADRVLRQYRANPGDPQFRQLAGELQRAIDVSVVAMHPNDTLDAIMRAYQIATDMHTKGGEHEAFESYGAAQVLEAVQSGFADPFIDSANLLLGTRDISDLRQRPELIFQTDQFTDEYGAPVRVPDLRGSDGKVSLELVLEAIANDADTGLAGILSEALLPRQYAYDRETGLTSVTTAGPRTLDDLVSRRYEKSFEARDGRFTDNANAALASEVSAAAQALNYNEVAVFERAVIAIVTPRILSSRGWSRTQIGLEVEKVRNQLATALRLAGNALNKSPELYESTVRQAVIDMVDAQLAAQRGRGENRGTARSLGVAVRSRTRQLIDEMIDGLIEQYEAQFAAKTLDEARADFEMLRDHASGKSVLDQLELAELHERIMSRGTTQAPMVELLNSIVSRDPLFELHAAFGNGENITKEQRRNITAYLLTDGMEIDVDQRVRHNEDARNALTNFRAAQGDNPLLVFDQTKLDWNMLSRIVLSHTVQSEAVEGWSTTDQMVVFMDDKTLDPTFSKVLEHLFDRKNPMVAAAAGISEGRPEPVSASKLHSSLMDLFPADGSIRWDQSVSAHATALDAMVPPISAGKAAGLHGNGAKVADALAMASRTYVPPKPPAPEYLKTATLEWTSEGFVIRGTDVPFLDTSVIEGAIGTVSVGGQPVSLVPMAGLPVAAPYQAITLQRLREHTPVVGMQVEVKYFHPMYRPSGSEHMNNIYFDGVIAHNGPQVSDYVSLIAEMYNQPNGILQLGTRSVLDAVKKKMPAVTRVNVTPSGGWDLSKSADPTPYLIALSQVLAEDTDFGYRGLGPAWGKATLKYITMRHLVKYDDGSFSSVSDYLAELTLDKDATIARKPELIPLSERTANSLYGETGTQGLQGYPMDGRISAGAQAFSWEALTPRQRQILKNITGKPVKLKNTTAAQRSAIPAAKPVKSSYQASENRDLADLVALVTSRDEVLAARRKWSKDLDLRDMRERQRMAANGLTQRDNENAFTYSDEFTTMLSQLGHEESEFSMANSYHLILTGQGSLAQGELTPTNYQRIGKELGRLTFGDTAVVDLEGLADYDVNTITDIIRVLMASKVTISLRGTNSRADGVPERTGAVVNLLRSTYDYEQMIEAADTFAPRESVHAYELETAYDSRLMEQGFRTATSRLMTLIPTGRTMPGFGGLNESQSYITNDEKRYVVSTGLIKQFTSSLATPLHAVEIPELSSLVQSLRSEIMALRPKDGVSSGLTFDEAVQDLMDRASTGTLQMDSENLHIRKGMFEVYVIRDREAGEKPKLYLHRYGDKFPRHNELVEFRRSADSVRIAKKSESEPQQTVVEGIVRGTRYHGPSDLQLILEAEQYWEGNKIIPLFGGNKTISTKLPAGLQWVRGPIAGKLEADYLAANADMVKKISLLDMVGTFSQAAEVLGFDNMPIFYRGFYGEDYTGAADDVKMSNLRDLMESVRKDSTATPGRIQNLVKLLARGIDGRQNAILSVISEAYSQNLPSFVLGSANTAEKRIFLAALAYLSLPGTNLASIERAGGFTTAESQEQGRGSLRMPTAFTSIYDLADDTRELAQRKFNEQLEAGWSLNPDYTLRRWYNDGESFQDFNFGYSLHSVVGEGVGTNADTTKPQSTSVHNTRLAEQAIGGLFATSHSAEAFGKFMDAATTWDTVAPLRLPVSGKNAPRPWLNLGPNRVAFRERVRDKLKYYFVTIDLKNGGETHPADVKELKRQIREIAVTLFADSSGRSDHHVHTLLRLALGRPAPSDNATSEEIEASRINLATLKKGLAGIQGNINLGISPLRRGAVPLLPLEIRNKIIEANAGKQGGWKMRMYSKGKRSEFDLTETAADYTAAIFDHALGDPEANNIAGFNNVLDAVVHQYQETTADLVRLPVSLDLMLDFDLIRRDMIDKATLQQLLTNKTSMAEFMRENPDLVKSSLFSSTETLLTPQFMHEVASSATMAQQLGLVDPKMIDNDAPSAEMLQYVEARFAAFDKKKDIPYPTKRSVQGRRDAGIDTTDNESNSHTFFRNLLSLHAFKALANPALAIGGLVDSRMRLVLSDTRRMITGEGTGFFGRRVANVVNSQGPVGALAQGFGFRAMYTAEQTQKFNRLLDTTATTSVMGAAINEDLADYADYLRSAGVWGWLQKANRIAANMQDIARGTKGKTLRRQYMHAAIAYAVANNSASVQEMLDGIGTSGDFVKRKYPDAHKAGIATMNDLRGTQETMLSSGISAGAKIFTHSGNGGVNAVAQMTLAMPLMFQRYAANLFLTLTGFRAFDQLAAHALNGRKKPGFWQELSAKAGGQTTETDQYIDMSDVIGSLDAMDAVINMGITHSILFTGGLVMGGLGLSGEDEEEKRRRRAAAAQGATWLNDPRDIENDFRNAHALFLDKIPGLNMLFANDAGRAIASPHWIIKPLTSPLLGMERFFDTGDIRQLKWGFEDAISSMPLLNMITFNKAVTMSEELSHSAQDAAASGNIGASDSAGFLTHLVSYYESALFESSFLNSLYVGFDDYDRDPYVMPLRDSDGNIQRDAEGNARANSDQHLRSEGLDGRGLALQTYVDDEGNVQQGYWQDSGANVSSRIMAENRLSFALISSLVTGLQGKGTNTRYDMAVKTRKVEKPKFNEAEQQAIVLGSYVAEAQQGLFRKGEQSAEQAIALSFLNEYGDEILTDEGAMAIFRGLAGGTVTARDAALQGVYVDFDARKNIQEKFFDELVVEGMRLGLAESQAKYRAGRVMQGDGNLPGLAEIIFSGDIPYSKTQEFQQLNTTYIQGPDGNIWATGFERTKLMGALGLAPLSGMHTSADTHTGMDERMNVKGFGINNTGMRSLRPVNDSLDTPTEAEIGDAITKAIEDLNLKDYGSGYGRRGGGGGGGYAQRPVTDYSEPPRWNNLNWNPIVLRTPYANDVYSIRTDNIRTDTSVIRRERISSERGRLTPWQ